MGAEWLALMFLVSLCLAVIRGAQKGAQSAGHLYRQAQSRLVKDALAAGHGRRARVAGHFSGRAAAATVRGSRLWLAAAWKGMREGWTEGRNRIRARRDGITDYVQTPKDTAPAVSVPGDVVDAPPETPGAPETPLLPRGARGQDTEIGKYLINNGRCPWKYPERHCGIRSDPDNPPFCPLHNAAIAEFTPPNAVPEPQPDPVPDEPPTPPEQPESPVEPQEGTTPVTTLETPDAGPAVQEIRTTRQLVEYLKKVEQAAVAELDEAKAAHDRATTDVADATAACARAESDHQNLTQALAHMTDMKLDAASLTQIEQVSASSARARAAAQARLTTSESAQQEANKRLTDANARSEEAAQAWNDIWHRHGGTQMAADEASVRIADSGAYAAV